MKQHYRKPLITGIRLDRAQAVLQACVVGGAYMELLTATTYCWGGTVTGVVCNTAARGRTSGTGNVGTPDSLPS